MSSYFIDHKSNENSGREIRKAARILTGNGQYIGYVGTYQFENMHGIDFADRLVPFYLCKPLFFSLLAHFAYAIAFQFGVPAI